MLESTRVTELTALAEGEWTGTLTIYPRWVMQSLVPSGLYRAMIELLILSLPWGCILDPSAPLKAIKTSLASVEYV